MALTRFLQMAVKLQANIESASQAICLVFLEEVTINSYHILVNREN